MSAGGSSPAPALRVTPPSARSAHQQAITSRHPCPCQELRAMGIQLAPGLFRCDDTAVVVRDSRPRVRTGPDRSVSGRSRRAEPVPRSGALDLAHLDDGRNVLAHLPPLLSSGLARLPSLATPLLGSRIRLLRHGSAVDRQLAGLVPLSQLLADRRDRHLPNNRWLSASTCSVS